MFACFCAPEMFGQSRRPTDSFPLWGPPCHAPPLLSLLPPAVLLPVLPLLLVLLAVALAVAPSHTEQCQSPYTSRRIRSREHPPPPPPPPAPGEAHPCCAATNDDGNAPPAAAAPFAAVWLSFASAATGRHPTSVVLQQSQNRKKRSLHRCVAEQTEVGWRRFRE